MYKMYKKLLIIWKIYAIVFMKVFFIKPINRKGK